MKFKYILIMSLLVTFDVYSQTVEYGNNIDESLMTVRFRSFDNTGGHEVYTGVPDVGDSSNRTSMNYSWWYKQHVTISYDAFSDVLSVSLYHCQRHEDDDDDFAAVESGGPCDDDDDDRNATRSPHNLHFPNWSQEVQSILGSQYSDYNLVNLSVSLYNRDDGEISFEDVQLNGEPLGGDFNIPPMSLPPTVDTWTVSGTCFQDFELKGFIIRKGDFSNSQELSKMEINIGTRAEEINGDTIFQDGFESCHNIW